MLLYKGDLLTHSTESVHKYWLKNLDNLSMTFPELQSIIPWPNFPLGPTKSALCEVIHNLCWTFVHWSNNSFLFQVEKFCKLCFQTAIIFKDKIKGLFWALKFCVSNSRSFPGVKSWLKSLTFSGFPALYNPCAHCSLLPRPVSFCESEEPSPALSPCPPHIVQHCCGDCYQRASLRIHSSFHRRNKWSCSWSILQCEQKFWWVYNTHNTLMNDNDNFCQLLKQFPASNSFNGNCAQCLLYVFGLYWPLRKTAFPFIKKKARKMLGY